MFMLIKSTIDCVPYTAVDGCAIREVLHPRQDPVDLPYSLAVAEVAVGARTYRHRLQQAEVYYLLEGRGIMYIEHEAREVVAGDAVFIPAGSIQWIENVAATNLRFVALVSPPWSRATDVRLEP
jgi:mannose-6-phosphate isomerase-like protein (cupin superfamily)